MRGLVWLVLTITVASSSWAQMAPEAAIRELLQQQTMDWNRGNVDAFMKGYDDSPETTFVGQSVQYGYATIRDRYKKLYTTPEAMGKLTFRNLAIRIVDSGCAVATGNFHLERSTAAGGNADGIFSLVLKKEPLGWKIVLDHTSRTS